MIKKIWNFLFGCGHRFELQDVTNLNRDPRCVYCNKTLTELK